MCHNKRFDLLSKDAPTALQQGTVDASIALTSSCARYIWIYGFLNTANVKHNVVVGKNRLI